MYKTYNLKLTNFSYSGNKQYRNHVGCTHVKNNGPLPLGKYWIVNRPTGPLKSEFKQFITKDVINDMQKTLQPVPKFVRLFIFVVFFILTFFLFAPIYSWIGDLFLAESVLWLTIKFDLGDVSYFGFLVLVAINLIPALVAYKLFLSLHYRKKRPLTNALCRARRLT